MRAGVCRPRVFFVPEESLASVSTFSGVADEESISTRRAAAARVISAEEEPCDQHPCDLCCEKPSASVACRVVSCRVVLITCRVVSCGVVSCREQAGGCTSRLKSGGSRGKV